MALLAADMTDSNLHAHETPAIGRDSLTGISMLAASCTQGFHTITPANSKQLVFDLSTTSNAIVWLIRTSLHITRFQYHASPWTSSSSKVSCLRFSIARLRFFGPLAMVTCKSRGDTPTVFGKDVKSLRSGMRASPKLVNSHSKSMAMGLAKTLSRTLSRTKR
ncbi:hypothetical protein BDD12DRAFT_182585 [Trichophaea hybrida]|nr:hypothetical protein BDD12DRAFT_182585 [Trichophaea hybrida]